uniref:Lysyl oxidase homolog n=1 Tax=Sphenodon punctatus TaxID=8508 RepID=A0A8D0L3F8_SPHPU
MPPPFPPRLGAAMRTPCVVQGQRKLLLCSVWLWVSVVAQTSPPAPTGQSQPGSKLQFRLAGYPRKHNEGRIEVFYNHEWGTICDDDFTLANAQVLCRHLGFVTATGWTHSAKYGKGVGRIWLDNVNCGGSEKSILDCKSRGWGNSDCTHEEDAGVVCRDERIPGFVDSNVIEVRAGEGVSSPAPVGPPEQRWELLAESCLTDQGVPWSWCTHPAAALTPSLPPGRLYAERQQLHYRLHSVACTGNEVHLSLCPFEFYKGNTTGACKGGMPAVVSCVPGPLFATGNAQKKKRQQQQQGQRIRLKGGAKPGEGRVEVLRKNEWGTVCDDRWSLLTASVVCRELGFGSAKEALTGARMGQGMGPIHLNEVQCTGSEKSLWSCPYKNITEEDCKHSEDAGIRCNIPYMGYETTETWYWDASNVTEMGLSGVKCSGHEMSLSQCQNHGTNVNCKRTGTRFAAGVICSETASDLLLHAPLVQETAYIEDRPLHMLYCAAEENCLASSSRKANWPYGHRRLLRFSSQIHNNGRADFRPKAGRHSWVWHECHGHYHSMDIFTHYDILTPNGTKVAEGHKASFCLEDTECQEGMQRHFACANFGEQGVSVGCWDTYRHDIDCQWVDITDVQPGSYIFQVGGGRLGGGAVAGSRQRQPVPCHCPGLASLAGVRGAAAPQS